MCEQRIIEQCCGTCRRWVQDQSKPWTGVCQLDGKERPIKDMRGCMGWKAVDPWELEMRGVKEDGE